MTRRKPETKVDLPADKAGWHPSFLAGQIVVVSSRSNLGVPHAASKSWISMVASRPPMLAFCCKISHRTAINVLETREFVINIPADDLAPRVWAAGDAVSAAGESSETGGWIWLPGVVVAAPRVQECRAHIECVLDSTRRFNEEEMIFFGRIVAVSADESLAQGPIEDRYRALRALLYLEGDLFAVIDGARKLPR